MQGPASYETVARITVISGVPGTGVFIYGAAPARGTLIAAAVGASGTDPTGLNTVSPVLSVGKWSAVTGLPGAQSMVDANGDLSVIGSDGMPRLKIYTGGDGIANHHAGAVWWLNDFGAAIQIIDPVIGGTFQYRDLGSSTQGGMIGAQVAGISTVLDPFGTPAAPGVTLIDPVFGDNINIAGDIVAFDQIGMTRKAFISSQDPGSVTQGPFLLVEGPEHTTAQHPNCAFLGATQDGITNPNGQLFYWSHAGTSPDPWTLIVTKAFAEFQPSAAQDCIAVVLPAAAQSYLLGRVSGDIANRFFIDFAGALNWGSGAAGVDTKLYRGGADQLWTDDEFIINAASAGIDSFAILVTGDTNTRYKVDSNGGITWGPGNALPDLNLFRKTAGLLRTDNNMEIGGTLNIPANAGAHFGVDISGNIYLVNAGSAANVQRTDATTSRLDCNTPSAQERSVSTTISSLLHQGPADIAGHTVTQAVFTDITPGWNILAADNPAPRNIYRLIAEGHGTQGSTAEVLSLQGIVGGTAVAGLNIQTAQLPVNAAFFWRAMLEVVTTAVGTTGTCNVTLSFQIGFGSGTTVGTTQMGQSRAVTINTTITNVLKLQAAWAAVTGAPTITCDSDWVEIP